jgi:hypothetical protein
VIPPRIAAGLAGVALCTAAHAALYVCEEGGQKVFRDRPCQQGQSAASSAEPAPAAPATTDKWDDSAPVSMTINVFSQVIAFRLPARWKPGHQSVKPLTYMAEFVPSSQDATAWSEMITVQGMRGFAAKVSPRRFLEDLSASIANACPAHYVAEFLGEATIDSLPAYMAILGCARYLAPTQGAKAGQGEVAVYVAIQGRDDLYLIHRAVRGERFDGGRSPITPENASALLKPLEIKICERGATNCLTRKPRG